MALQMLQASEKLVAMHTLVRLLGSGGVDGLGRTARAAESLCRRLLLADAVVVVRGSGKVQSKRRGNSGSRVGVKVKRAVKMWHLWLERLMLGK